MARRDYQGNAIPTELSGAINNTSLTINIVSATGWPSGGANGKFFVTIDRGLPTEERILIQSRSGNTLTVASVGDRGVDDTTAVNHSIGATIEHTFSAVDADEANRHITDTSQDDHTQYLTTGRHDVEARHSFGGALGTPSAAADIGTVATTGSGDDAAREDHVHKIGAGAINSSGMFAANVVDAAAIAADSVGTSEIAPTSVTAAELAANAVTTGKILDANVTPAKFATVIGRHHLVADDAALAALTGLREGDSAYQLDEDRFLVYNGTAWRCPHPLGLVDSEFDAVGVTIATAGDIFPTAAEVTIVNTDTVERQYLAKAQVRFSMAGGSNGLYRPGVCDGAGVNIGTTYIQCYTNVVGGPGAVGGFNEALFTLDPAESKDVAAYALRVAGGNVGDTATAQINVYDLGPA